MKQALKGFFGKSSSKKAAVTESGQPKFGVVHQQQQQQQQPSQPSLCYADPSHNDLPSGHEISSLAMAEEASGTDELQQSPHADTESSVIAVAEHCPAAMLKDVWSLDAFEIRAKMYAGQISSVYRAVDKKSGITVGLKLYKRSMLNDMERHQIAREIWLHMQLNHPNIIALYAAWKDKDYIYLVLEWAPEGNVFMFAQTQRNGRLPENVVVPLILEPTMSALAYIHGLGMIHRDVKPENILLTTSYQIKLADFGLSIHSNYEIANTRLGTIDYLSPEILDCPPKYHPQDHKSNPQIWYTNKVDCWSVGVLAYELLAGKTPFEDKTPQETLYRIKSEEVSYPLGLSEGAVAFMRQALVRDPAQRSDMQELLNHPWILSHKRHAVLPSMRSRTQTQSEIRDHRNIAFMSSAGGPGSLGAGGGSHDGSSGAAGMEASCRVHSYGNMKVPLTTAGDAGHNSSCPNILQGQMLSSTGHMMSGVDAYTLPAVHDLAAFSAEGDMQGVTSQQHQQQQDMMMMQSIAATQGVTAMDTGS
eukprot:jgi/Chrzof1/10114/Cz04g29080.t1